LNPFQKIVEFADINASVLGGAGVEIVTDVRVDPDAPMLSFDTEGASRSYWVDKAGISALRAAADRFAPIVELTLDEGGRGHHVILLAPLDPRGPGHWGIARMIRLSRFIGLDGGAAFESFLSQTSGVLADIHHDIRQHLSALSLAAHNGLGLLRAGKTDQAMAKFDRILGQVASCEDLMQDRAPGHGTAQTGAMILPFVVAIHAALAPARDWMAKQADATLIVSGLLPAGSVYVPPGAIEMLLGYILRQTAEAIRHCAVRVVNVVLDESAQGLRVIVRHDGALPESAIGWDGLALTLAERVMGHIGGKMLAPNEADRRGGLVVTLSFPRYAPPSNDMGDQLALANSLR
jgi:hypothetical protein